MPLAEIDKLLLNLLEEGVFKTTAQLVQEFRTEYPASWRALEEAGERLYEGGCGASQLPTTRIRQALFALPEEKCLCIRRGSEHLWSRPGNKQHG